MIKRQKSIRLLSLVFHQNHHHRHSLSQSRLHSHWGCCFMATSAAASSSVVGKNDLLFSGESHAHHRNHKAEAVPNAIGRISSWGKVWARVTTSGGGGREGLLRINGLTLRCCSDNGKGFGNDATNNTYSFQKVWTFSASLPKLTRDSEIRRFLENEGDARLTDSRGGACHRGSPLGYPNRALPEKVVVAVDVDEVLGNFVSALNRFIADRYSLNCSVSEYHVYEFFKIWNCSRDEADIRVHEFFKTKYFKTGIHPIPGARQALQKLTRFCNLSVVTSRQNAIKDHTINWIENHYPGLFREIHFGNHFALDGQSRPKSDICKSLGAKVLIDDNPRYALECAEVGIRVLLFDYENSYPWCKTQSIDQNPLVTKVHNWEEVEQHLLSWIAS